VFSLVDGSLHRVRLLVSGQRKGSQRRSGYAPRGGWSG
jgi:hypothetical protein